VSISLGKRTKNKTDENLIEDLDKAEEKMYRNKTLERGEFKRKAIESIIHKLHEIDPKEKEHSQNVSELAQRLGKEIGLSEEELWKLKIGAYLHDIGKIVFDDSIPYHESYMDNDGREKHTLVGYRIRNSIYTVEISDIVISHHEQWDGRGYPRVLKEEEIPLLTRMITIADFYDKITNTYVNEGGPDLDFYINVLKKNSAIKLDPHLVEVFIQLITTNPQY